MDEEALRNTFEICGGNMNLIPNHFSDESYNTLVPGKL